MTHREAPEPAEIAKAPLEAIMLDMDLRQWNERMNSLMAQGTQIIALRGSGTVNGIEPEQVQGAVEALQEHISHITAEGTPVAVIFDGDADNREWPDIGTVFGLLTDQLKHDLDVTTMAAQMRSWYSPSAPNAALQTAGGTPYETYVFPDEVPGTHTSLTQSEALVGYPRYEQFIVGAVGPIVRGQLEDLNRKHAQLPPDTDPIKVTVYKLPQNPAVDAKLREQLIDDDTRGRTISRLSQRERYPWGMLCAPDGTFVYKDSFPGITFELRGTLLVKEVSEKYGLSTDHITATIGQLATDAPDNRRPSLLNAGLTPEEQQKIRDSLGPQKSAQPPS